MRRLIIASLFLPTFLLAQTSAETRAEIRASLMEDPRTAQMSSAELDALVDALVTETETSKEGAMYLDAQSDPTFTYDPPPVGTVSPFLSLLTAPIVIAVLALLVSLIAVIVFMFRHRRMAGNAADLQNS